MTVLKYGGAVGQFLYVLSCLEKVCSLCVTIGWYKGGLINSKVEMFA